MANDPPNADDEVFGYETLDQLQARQSTFMQAVERFLESPAGTHCMPSSDHQVILGVVANAQHKERLLFTSCRE